MKIKLPILTQVMKDGDIQFTETEAVFDIDTSVYSEERWEQNFPALAEKEGLFQYIERIQENAISDRVKVASMLKAIFCFVESSTVTTYKEFAQLFNFAVPEYTTRLVTQLKAAFELSIGGSSVKN